MAPVMADETKQLVEGVKSSRLGRGNVLNPARTGKGFLAVKFPYHCATLPL